MTPCWNSSESNWATSFSISSICDFTADTTSAFVRASTVNFGSGVNRTGGAFASLALRASMPANVRLTLMVPLLGSCGLA